MKELTFIVDKPIGDSSKGVFDKIDTTTTKLPVDKLKKEFIDVQDGLSELFKDMNSVGDFKLKKITMGIEISVEGGINIIATAKAGSKGTINLTFEPQTGLE